MSVPIITATDRIRLRGWKQADANKFSDMNKDPQVMQYLGPPLSSAQSRAAMESQNTLMAKGEPAFWALERRHDNAFMGFVGVKAINFETNFTPGYEIGWRLSPQFWGHGFATEGAIAALKATFAKWDMPTIYSFTVPKNKKSQSVMQRIGMQRVNGGDFDHPKLDKTDPLLRHVLYKIDRAKP